MEEESRKRLMPMMDSLAEAHPSHELEIQDLHGWLLNSQAAERHRMNAYRISQSTAIPVGNLIRIFLWGTQKSIFQLHWQQHCPHCNMITAEFDSLSVTTGESFCKMCDVEFTVDFKERVEVTFSLHPSIEELDIPPFCLPPKSLKPLVQLSMARGEVEEADFSVEPGIYRYYCPITMSMGKLQVEQSASKQESELSIRQQDNNTFDPPELRIPAGEVHLKAENSTVPISGLIIHEGQLTYVDHDLSVLIDLGKWWNARTNNWPMPLGGNVVRRDLGEEVMQDITKYTKMSIEYALASPDEALEFAKAWGRGIDDDTNREFVGMYVNDRTIDYKEEGRASIRQFISEGQEIGLIRSDFDTGAMRFIGEP